MSNADARQSAIRLLANTVLWMACVFAWVAVLTFDVADLPSTSVWPRNGTPTNWCGSFGALLAFGLRYYLGLGGIALLVLLTAGLAARAPQARKHDFWLRAVGTVLICAVVSVVGALCFPPNEHMLISGPGGVLGAAVGFWMKNQFELGGSLLLLTCAFVVGLILVADEFVLRLFTWAGTTAQQAGASALRGGVQGVASAGAALAAGVSRAARTDAGVALETVQRANDGEGRARSRVATPPPVRTSLDDDSGADEDAAADAEADPRLAAPTGTSSSEDAEIEDRTESDEESAAERVPPDDDYVEPQHTSATNGAPETKPAPVRSMSSSGAAEIDRGGFLFDMKPAPRPAVPPPAKRFPEYVLPNSALLDDLESIDKSAIESVCREKAYILEQTLNEFRVQVQVASIETGPVITVFELKLAPGVKVSQIASLSNDMARALKAPAVRVVAPLPGRNTIGIEVPNIDKEKVRIKELLRASQMRAARAHVPLFLGKDASGQPLISDLTAMPHLLIAGTTGSGKSVCVASVILSILMTRTPDEVQLILVDPKVVELAMFKEIPHLMCPIVTDPGKAESILDWACTQMDERYALLAEAGVKDIRSYNQLGEKGLRERLQIEAGEELGHVPVHLPYIVMVVDELADLMMTSPKEVEFHLCRLAQKSRAVGIHLLVSTQRPQANVVTGLIKSNLPCRIAFRVASRLDSRIVLDQNGGEVLMGQGDMLFLPPGASKLIRAQGTFISDEELRAVVKHCREQGDPQFHPELVRMPKSDSDASGERDEMFDQAVDIIVSSARGSVSLLQRRLMIGYGRASRLVDQMYAAGIVGEYKGSQAREVLIAKDEWEKLKAMRDREEAAELDQA